MREAQSLNMKRMSEEVPISRCATSASSLVPLAAWTEVPSFTDLREVQPLNMEDRFTPWVFEQMSSISTVSMFLHPANMDAREMAWDTSCPRPSLTEFGPPSYPTDVMAVQPENMYAADPVPGVCLTPPKPEMSMRGMRQPWVWPATGANIIWEEPMATDFARAVKDTRESPDIWLENAPSNARSSTQPPLMAVSVKRYVTTSELPVFVAHSANARVRFDLSAPKVAAVTFVRDSQPAKASVASSSTPPTRVRSTETSPSQSLNAPEMEDLAPVATSVSTTVEPALSREPAVNESKESAASLPRPVRSTVVSAGMSAIMRRAVRSASVAIVCGRAHVPSGTPARPDAMPVTALVTHVIFAHPSSISAMERTGMAGLGSTPVTWTSAEMMLRPLRSILVTFSSPRKAFERDPVAVMVPVTSTTSISAAK